MPTVPRHGEQLQSDSKVQYYGILLVSEMEHYGSSGDVPVSRPNDSMCFQMSSIVTEAGVFVVHNV